MVDDWPSHSEELARKSLETVARWTRLHAQGRIRDRDLYLIVDAVCDTISGLIPDDDLQSIYAIRQELLSKRKNKNRANCQSQS